MKIVYKDKQVANTTQNYNALGNKPQLNGVELVGTLTTDDIGVYKKSEVDQILADTRAVKVLDAMGTAVPHTLYFIGPDADGLYHKYVTDAANNLIDLGTTRDYQAGSGIIITSEKVIKVDYDENTMELTRRGKIAVRLMEGADSEHDGHTGLVPTPTSSEREYFLKGTGEWVEVDLSVFKGATDDDEGKKGLVPAPINITGDYNKFLKGDGTWKFAPMHFVCMCSAEKDAVSKPINNLYRDLSLGDVITVRFTKGNSVPVKDITIRINGNDYSTYAYKDPSIEESSSSTLTFMCDDPVTHNLTWIPEKTFVGATTSENGFTGLVPAPTSSENGYYLNADGTWKEVDLSVFKGANVGVNGEKGLVPAPEFASTEYHKFLKGTGDWCYVNNHKVGYVKSDPGNDEKVVEGFKSELNHGDFLTVEFTQGNTVRISRMKLIVAGLTYTIETPVTEKWNDMREDVMTFICNDEVGRKLTWVPSHSFQGASTDNGGNPGLVPFADSDDYDYYKYLRGDGNWVSLQGVRVASTKSAADAISKQIDLTHSVNVGDIVSVDFKNGNTVNFSDMKLNIEGDEYYIECPIAPSVSEYTNVQSALFVCKLNGGKFFEWIPEHMFKGATATANGLSGLVPAPTTSEVGYFLNASGKWEAVEGTAADSETIIFNSENKLEAVVFTGATGSTAGKKGIVPAPEAGSHEKFLKADGTWSAGPTEFCAYTSDKPDALTITADVRYTGARELIAGDILTVYYTNGTKVLNPDIILKSGTTDLGTYRVIKYGDMTVPGGVSMLRFKCTGNGGMVLLPIESFIGATTSEIGYSGLVPSPTSSEAGCFLRGDGKWAAIEGTEADSETIIFNADNKLEAVVFKGATDTEGGKKGLVPAPISQQAQHRYFLSADGTWKTGTSVHACYCNDEPDSTEINVKTIYGNEYKPFVGETIFVKFNKGHKAGIRTLKFYTGGSLVETYDCTSSSEIFPTGGVAQMTFKVTFLNPAKVILLPEVTFIGANDSEEGYAGLVPAPTAGDSNRVLRADGSWKVIEGTKADSETIIFNSENTLEAVVFKGSTDTEDGAKGIVPAPKARLNDLFLKSDGKWAIGPTEFSAYSDDEPSATEVTAKVWYSGARKLIRGDILTVYFKKGTTNLNRKINLMSGTTSLGTYTVLMYADMPTTGGVSMLRFKCTGEGDLALLPGGIFIGASTSEIGYTGLVPSPTAGELNRFLRADGSWVKPDGVPEDSETIIVNSEQKLEAVEMKGSKEGVDGKAGIVPAPKEGTFDHYKYLSGSGEWKWAPAHYTCMCNSDAGETTKELDCPYGPYADLAYGDTVTVNFTKGNNQLIGNIIVSIGGTEYLIQETLGVFDLATSKEEVHTFVCVDPVGHTLVPIPTPIMKGATSAADGGYGFVPTPAKEDVDKLLGADGNYHVSHRHLALDCDTAADVSAKVLKDETGLIDKIKSGDYITIKFRNPNTAWVGGGRGSIQFTGTSGVTQTLHVAASTFGFDFYNPGVGVREWIGYATKVEDATNACFTIFENPEYEGATATTNGIPGLVPVATIANKDKFLKADGTWSNPTVAAEDPIYINADEKIALRYDSEVLNVVDSELTVKDYTGATSAKDGVHGLVPSAAKADVDKLLGADGKYHEGRRYLVFTCDTAADATTKVLTDPSGTIDKIKENDYLTISFLNPNEAGIAAGRGKIQFTGTSGELQELTVVTTGESGHDMYSPGTKLKQWSGFARGLSGTSAMFSLTTDFNFYGASATRNGTNGLVPMPSAGDQNKFLKGNGLWSEVSASGTTINATVAGVWEETTATYTRCTVASDYVNVQLQTGTVVSVDLFLIPVSGDSGILITNIGYTFKKLCEGCNMPGGGVINGASFVYNETTDKLHFIGANIFTGATDDDGYAGLVPAPKGGELNKFLKSDGTWSEVSGPDSETIIFNSEDKLEAVVMTGATSTADGKKGLVPAAVKEDVDKLLGADGTYHNGHRHLMFTTSSAATSTTKELTDPNVITCPIDKIKDGDFITINFANPSQASGTDIKLSFTGSSGETQTISVGAGFDYSGFSPYGGVGYGLREWNGIVTGNTFDLAMNPQYQGATASAAGVPGLVPYVGAGDTGKVLKSNGTWGLPDTWVGTQAQYDAITTKDTNRLYIITD